MDSKREAVQDGPALLRQERAQASFPLRDMTHFLDGGPQRTAKKEALRAIALQDPLFSLESNQNKAFLSREERYRNGLRLINRVQALRLKHGWTHEERVLFEEEACTESLPTGLNDVAFVPFVRSQGTEEQIQKWAVPAENYEIIGSYSQTELGHGSNVQGLQTTALYLPDSDEFELNTDSITATKWWPGAIAHTATHTVLMARLLIPDHENKNKIKDYGVHGFVVQLRCLETHQPLPGITLGDIGPKMGSPAVDNGFMRLQGVRIPRTNMLMRHAQVEKGTGAYSKPPHSKIAYLGMVYIRVKLVLSAASALARGVTVATRYSAVRRQFGPEPGAPEKQLLDYKLQQYRILPHVARTYALIFTGRYMQNLFDTLSSHLASYSSSSASSSSDPFATLPLVHATSSGLKSWCTFMAAEGLESCRRTLGGHGYAHYSGISEITAGYVGILAAEGENYLLTQQTARYLLKLFEKTKREKRVPEEASMADYLEKCREEGILEREKCTATTLQELLLPETLLDAFGHRTARILTQVAQLIAEQMMSGKAKKLTEAWSNALIEIAALSKAHSTFTILVCFVRTLEEIKSQQPKLYSSLQRLCSLYALYEMEQNLGEFMEDGYLSSAQAKLVRDGLRQVLDDVRPDAVPLVDALNIPDHILASCLGRYDGRVYEAMYEWVQGNPMNKTAVNSGYEYIRPLIRKELKPLGHANL